MRRALRLLIFWAIILTTFPIFVARAETRLSTSPRFSFLGQSLHSDSIAHSQISPQAGPPPPEGWIALAEDKDEGSGTNLKAIQGQFYFGVIYFQVTHWRPWSTLPDIDTGIGMDADQNPTTGLPDGFYPGQDTGIGADYLIVVGWEGTQMWKWDPIIGFWDIANPIPLAYLDTPDGTNVFVAGVFLSDVKTVGALDIAAADPKSSWDWMPDVGHATLRLLQIAIYTDKYFYSLGDTMHLGLNITNPGNGTTIHLAIAVEDPKGSIKVILSKHVLLPAGLSYSNPNFKMFTLPSIPSGIYTWHAALLEEPGHAMLAHDLSQWEFV